MALSFLLAGFGLYLMIRGFHGLRGVSGTPAWDFGVDYQTARGFLYGPNPFTEGGALELGLPQNYFGASGSGHPPTTSFWALPFTPFPLDEARNILAAVSLVLVFTQLVGMFRELAWPQTLGVVWVAFAYLIWCPFMPYHLAVGQLSVTIGFLYFVAWRTGRRGADVLSGVAIGLAATIKLFPGTMLFFLLAARRWRALLAAAVAYLSIAAIMTSRYGLAAWPFFLGKQAPIVRSWMGVINNQSIHGVVLRLFNPVCGPQGVPSTGTILLSTVLALGLLAMGVWVTYRRTHTRLGYDRSFALFVVLSVITSQWTWEHYLVIYVLPAIILFDDLARDRVGAPSRPARWAMMIALAGVVASWSIDVNLKSEVRQAFLANRTVRGTHLQLHALDLANWLPGFVLAAMLFARSLGTSRSGVGERRRPTDDLA